MPAGQLQFSHGPISDSLYIRLVVHLMACWRNFKLFATVWMMMKPVGSGERVVRRWCPYSTSPPHRRKHRCSTSGRVLVSSPTAKSQTYAWKLLLGHDSESGDGKISDDIISPIAGRGIWKCFFFILFLFGTTQFFTVWNTLNIRAMLSVASYNASLEP